MPSKYNWLIPGGLILLSLLPVVGATTLSIELSGLAEVDEDNFHFHDAPVPIVAHAVSGSAYLILGALQFSPGLRQRHPKWHRTAGRILIPAGLVSATSAMWMALFYPPLFGEGIAISYIRLAAGGAMALFICLGFRSVRRREFNTHRAWMIRAYALGIAAGTQPFTLAPMVIFPALYGELWYTLGLSAGWIINLAVAEWLISRGRGLPVRPALQDFAR